MNVCDMEREALLYWKLSSAICEARRSADEKPDMAAEVLRLVDDMACVAMHSDWELLRKRAEAFAGPAQRQQVAL